MDQMWVKSYKNVKTVKNKKLNKKRKNEKKNYLNILQTLHLQQHQNRILIYSLNFVTDVNNFTFVGSLFHILGRRAVKLLLL